MQVIIGLPAQHWLKQREKNVFLMKSKSKKKVTKYMHIDPPPCFCLRERERERELLEFKPKALVTIYHMCSRKLAKTGQSFAQDKCHWPPYYCPLFYKHIFNYLKNILNFFWSMEFRQN